MRWFRRRDARPTAQDAAKRVCVLRSVVAYVLGPPAELLQVLASVGRLRDVAAGLEGETAERLAQVMGESDNLVDSLSTGFWTGLRQAGLWNCLSPHELALAQTPFSQVSPRQRIDASWRLEATRTLLWALGKLDELGPWDMQAEPAAVLPLVPENEVARFIADACLRPAAELDEARGLAELWHWRSRTRQLQESGKAWPDDPKLRAAGLCSYEDVIRLTAQHGADEGRLPTPLADDFPAKGKPYRELTDEEWAEVTSIAVERHFALNWLCGKAPANRWDDTPTDT